ncbi:MAG: hypothetical protein IKN63_04450 [Bacilli bacterium]|nr:hypothetical protein [Bacilli bacterium]
MLNLRNFKSNGKLILKLSKDNIEYFINKTKRIIKYCDKHKLNLEVYYDNKMLNDKDLEKKLDKNIRDIITIMKAINIKDKYKRYEYIYDTVCSYLDELISTNYCDFKNDICIRDRLKGTNHKNGCCECLGRGKCKYLIDSVCTEKSCMACKLFTCKTLREKGIVHNLNDYVLIKYFFTNKQKDILRFSYWTPKEIILDRLVKNKYVRP